MIVFAATDELAVKSCDLYAQSLCQHCMVWRGTELRRSWHIHVGAETEHRKRIVARGYDSVGDEYMALVESV